MAILFSGRKLWRIPQRGILKGVCAGIAQYLGVPVKLVRLIVILSLIFGLFFLTITAYIILSFALDPMPGEEMPGQSPGVSLNDVDAALAQSERRLRRMERYITSDAFSLRSRFRQI